MDILIVGNGGREHALAWKLKQSPKVTNIFVASGNGGTAQIAKNIAASTTEEIVAWLTTHTVDLVIVGPDEHLANGLVDTLQERGIAVFGPTQKAAEIEWSKSFAKQFMKEEGIPTASYTIFKHIEEAKAFIQTQDFPLVIKANGLALGKGVVIAQSLHEANKALDEMMLHKIFGKAGEEIIIEEYLNGDEISVHAFCDGENVEIFPPAQDHKRIFDNDEGPNTGGMGTIAPVSWVTLSEMDEIKNKIVIPTINALRRRGRPFKGVLFPGIIFTSKGPYVLEFNARFGDPEAQVYMQILETDLLDILLACIQGKLKTQKVKWSAKSACCIVCASGGYPNSYEKGKVITGLDAAPSDVTILHAGTKKRENEVVTNGGRVLGVCAIGNELNKALQNAYAAIQLISFDGMQYRKDIGAKSLHKLKIDQ